MQYTVTMRFLGEYIVSVDADSERDARGKAIAMSCSADLNDLTNINMTILGICPAKEGSNDQ